MTRHRSLIPWVGLLVLSCVNGTDIGAPNPVPFADHVEPQLITVGTPAPSISVFGADFVEGAVGSWNGSERSTELVSPTELRIVLNAADVQAVASGLVSVTNPGPGGGESQALSVHVGYSTPSIAQLEPDSARAVIDEGVELHVTGSGFAQGVDGARVIFRGVAIPTTVVSEDELVAWAPAHLLRTAGAVPVHVVNPAPGGGRSGSLQFRVTNPLPAIDSLSADSVRWADPAEIALFGGPFVQGSVVRMDGVALTPHALNERTIVVRLPNGPPARGGRIRVEAPAPGGGLSNEVVIGIQEQKPTITGTDPQAVEVGGGSQTFRVKGRDFAPDATVTLKGSPRVTTFVDSTTVEFETEASDAASMGAGDLVVVNPRGGGPSDPASLPTVPVGRIAFAWRFGIGSLTAAALTGADRESIPTELSAVSVDTWPNGRDLLIAKGIGYSPEPGLFRVTPGGDEVMILDEIAEGARITNDESWIYFWRDPDIMRVRPDGTDEDVVVSGDLDTLLLGFPDPSPSGDRLIHTRYRPEEFFGDWETVVLDLQTMTTLLSIDGAKEARWSPDGAWIAYRDGADRLRLVRPNGTEDQAIPALTNFVGEGSFDWSPDGEYLITVFGNRFQVLELATGEVLDISGADCDCPYAEYPTSWIVSWYPDPGP